MEWLIAHPEDSTAAGRGASGTAASADGDEQQLAQALAASLKAGEPSKDATVRLQLTFLSHPPALLCRLKP